MNLPGPIHDFLLVFLGLGLILGGLGVVLLTNPIFSAFFIRISSCLYILILYFIKLLFCSCDASPYLCGSYKYFNFICCNVHEWFRILQRFQSLDCWEWSYFSNLYKSFCFTNYYYFKYNMLWDYLDYKSKPDCIWIINLIVFNKIN